MSHQRHLRDIRDTTNMKPFVTNASRTDGFGAQFQDLIWTHLWADITGKSFVYTDIENIDLITKQGSTKDTENENTLQEVVDYMGFNRYCVNRNSIEGHVGMRGPDVFPYVERNMEHVFTSTQFLKYKEFFYKDKVNRFNNDYINVAVHIRKLGNFERENGRFRAGTHDLADSYYLDKMNMIRDKYKDKGKKLLFHIYSQGVPDIFKNLIADDTILHLNEKVLDTFTDLVFADVLVTCKSSFSYTAAFLSNGEVYYLSFWHPPRNHWLRFHV